MIRSWMLLIALLWSPLMVSAQSPRAFEATSSQDVLLQYDSTARNVSEQQAVEDAITRGLDYVRQQRLSAVLSQWATYFQLLTPAEQAAEIARIATETAARR